MTPAELQPKLAEKNNMDQMTPQGSCEWVRYLPEGGVSIEMEGATLVLRANKKLQKRFDTLLTRRKAGTLSPVESHQYEAICGLDTTLSWLNRLARGAGNHGGRSGGFPINAACHSGVSVWSRCLLIGKHNNDFENYSFVPTRRTSI